MAIEIWLAIAIVAMSVWGIIGYECFKTRTTITANDIKLDAMQQDTKLADEISFRLLATRKHPDYNWLVEKLNNR
jgi:hypothetical protein